MPTLASLRNDFFGVTVTVALAACGPKVDLDPGATGTGTDAASTGGGSTDGATSMPTTTGGESASTTSGGTVDATGATDDAALDSTTSMTSAGSTSETTATDDTGASSSSTTTLGSTTLPETEGGECFDPLDQPQNAECKDPSGCGCASNSCFVVPALGGFCGECKVDAECPDGGCTLPNLLKGLGAVCNDGGPGDGCQSDDVCATPGAPHCAEVIVVPGLLTIATCGACEVDDDCQQPGAPLCSPDLDMDDLTGQWVCVAPKSVPNDAGCSLVDVGGGEPAGDAACASGKCGEASVMGLFKVGICGECSSDLDCEQMGKDTCTDPLVDLNTGTLTGATCI